MAEQSRNVSAVSWALAIEALAYSQEVDVDTLIETFNSCPKLTGDVGSNAREMVSFRILERLFDHDNRCQKSVGRKSGVSFDFSKRCEDVLEHILSETPEPNTWNESEMSKWNVQPFIAYKRSCLPKPSLQRLKDALLEGTPTFLKSFHELVTSLQLNQHGTKANEVNGASINNDNETFLHLNQHGTKTREVNDATFTNENENPGTNDNVCQDTSNESQPSKVDELHLKELNGILAKKQEFFSSVCKVSERVTQSKKANRCMKCDKGGELLVCSSNNCAFVFHESCLASESSFDYEPTGKFYCPFCRYSQALSDYRAAEKKTSLARNNLVSFNRSTLNHMPKTSLNEPKIPNGASGPDFTILVDESPGNPSKPPNGVSKPEVISDRSESCRGNGCSEGTGKENGYVDRAVRLRERTKPPNGASNLNLYDESSESSDGKGCREGSNREENYVVHAVRPRKRTLSSPSVQVPQRRRVPVPWTQSEEDTLKKWVAKFTSDSNILGRGFPWSRILDLGASKFQSGRTPVDLKDKWRNLQKASKRSK